MIFTISEITLLTAAGNYTFQFRGSDKAHMAYRYVMKQILSQAHPWMPAEPKPKDFTASLPLAWEGAGDLMV